MSYAVTNTEDQIGKLVGRRGAGSASNNGMRLQETANQLRASFGQGGICPRGVFRFNSHEEADAWMMKKLVERAIRSRS